MFLRDLWVVTVYIRLLPVSVKSYVGATWKQSQTLHSALLLAAKKIKVEGEPESGLPKGGHRRLIVLYLHYIKVLFTVLYRHWYFRDFDKWPPNRSWQLNGWSLNRSSTEVHKSFLPKVEYLAIVQNIN